MYRQICGLKYAYLCLSYKKVKYRGFSLREGGVQILGSRMTYKLELMCSSASCRHKCWLKLLAYLHPDLLLSFLFLQLLKLILSFSKLIYGLKPPVLNT